MTKQYLKMADVFSGSVIVRFSTELRDGCGFICDAEDEDQAKYILHAINSHDDLVQQNINMQLRINELLAERNATGVAIDNAISGRLPEHHPMLNRLRMIANIAAHRNELIVENERMKTLVVRAALMLQQSGVTPEKESLNPLRQWLYDAFCEVGDEANLDKALYAAIKNIQGGAE